MQGVTVSSTHNYS